MENMKEKHSSANKWSRKITSPDGKSQQVFSTITNLKSYLLTKKSSSKRPSGKIDNSGKIHTQSSKKLIYQNKSYLLNKTALGSPFDKSAIFSYISTPNEKSFNFQKMKMMKADKSLLTFKTKEQFQSTEDEYLSEETVKVNFILNNKRLFSKTFFHFSNLSTLKQEFLLEYQQYMSQNISQKSKNNPPYFGIIGFQSNPVNYTVNHLLNNTNNTFQYFINQGVKELNLTPMLLKKKFSDFQIIKFLGSGGFSQVYLAKCKLDHQYCALKFIRKDSITSAKKVKMLENQKNILFSIKHEHLIDLYYAFQTKNYIVFGLEYCPNGNLYSYLQKCKTLKEQQAKEFFIEILNGLEYLHANNILFRDIKLENILFDVNGKIKITDFGLSKPDIDENEITYSYCGSPEYMAPEMLTKSGHSYQVDYYALGILLYELLFGRSPFYASKKEDIFSAILNSEPKFPKSPLISKEVKSLIRGLLTKNPNHRIGSLKGVKQILTHPWLRTLSSQENQPNFTRNTQIPRIFSSNNGLNLNKETQNAKQQFIAQQSCKNYQKCFFTQNFVNRALYENILEKIIKFKNNQKDREVKLKNNFLKTTSNSKKKQLR